MKKKCARVIINEVLESLKEYEYLNDGQISLFQRLLDDAFYNESRKFSWGTVTWHKQHYPNTFEDEEVSHK